MRVIRYHVCDPVLHNSMLLHQGPWQRDEPSVIACIYDEHSTYSILKARKINYSALSIYLPALCTR